MSNKHKIVLILIFFLGLFLRTYKLGEYPASLNWDEVSHGYTAYSILKTSKDQWGQKLPIFNFRAYGDYPTTLNMYTTIPLIKLLGLQDWVIRLPTAILGASMIISAYFISQYFLQNGAGSLLVSLLVAISPWTFFSSRGVYQSTVGQAIFMLGLAVFFRQKNKFALGFGSLIISLSVFGYHSNRIVSSLILVYLIYKYKRTIIQQHLFSKLLITISILIICFSTINIISPESRARSAWVGILNISSENTINEARRISPQPEIIKKVLYNKATYLIPRLIGNFFNLQNPIPLFVTGSNQYQYNLPNFGLIYPTLSPFFYLGLIIILFNPKRSKNTDFLVLWAVALIPSLITTGDFPTLRLATIIPLPFIAITYALIKLPKLFRPLILLVTIPLFIFYYYQYFFNYNTTYSSSWQYGYKQVVEIVRPLYPQYDHIIITKKYGEPHEFVLYYWPWDPQTYQQDQQKITDYHANWYWVDAFDKFVFVNDWEMSSYLLQHNSENNLIITSPNNYPKDINYSHLQTINFLNQQPAFEIIANEI